MKKKGVGDYLTILLAGSLLLIVFVLAIFSFSASSTKAPTPTSTPVLNHESTTNNPPVKYDKEAGDRLLEKFTNRTPLSSEDAAVKKKVLSSITDGASGSVYQSSRVRLDYTAAPDLFQAEILSVDIAGAKADATSWLSEQGMSPSGICNLPLQFYLNSEVIIILRGRGILFSPLPPGC